MITQAYFKKFMSENMKPFLFCLAIFCVLAQNKLYGQCDFTTPPAVKKIQYATREITFSEVTINGKQTTYLAVQKGETVNITTTVSAKKNGDYCPGCIVQVYWGIHGYTSVCAKSFGGYQFRRKKSKHTFKAPMKDGIYYITMGGSLEYSCKNNNDRPACSPENAFAVLKVGNPSSGKKVKLEQVKKASSTFLKTTLIQSDCFGDFENIEWFLGGEKLAYDNQKEIPLKRYGTYKVQWSNCSGSATATFYHTPKKEDTSVETPATDNNSDDIAALVENNDKFVLEHLIFDLGKATIKPEAKEELDKLAKVMKEHPSMRILLEGHTDNRGSAKKNQLLSEKRVASAKEYLVLQGVPSSNIETKGWGQRKPLIITQDIEKAKVNRRVEVRILSR